MAYEIIWSPKAKEELKNLEVDLIKRIITKIEGLKLAPYHFVEKLTNTTCWKLRVGDYRVVFDIEEQKKEIYILTVGHRKNIYK